MRVKPGLEWRVTLGLRRKVSWQEPNPKFTPDGVNLKLNLKKTETKKSRLVLGSCSGRSDKMVTGRQRSKIQKR